MKTRHIFFTVLAIGFIALIIYRISAGREQTGGAPGAKTAGGGGMNPTAVEGVVIKPEEFSNNLTVTGSIEANEQVQLQSQVSGLVKGIYFNEGSMVDKGEVLVKIDDSELQAQLAQAQTRQNLAAENERRAGLLLQKEALSREEYDVARADLKSAQAQTQLIRAQIAKTSIRAPFSGRIGLRNVSVGAYLSPQTVIANLFNTNPVKITFSVPEKYSNQVKVNTDIKFTVAGSKKSYTATIYAIEPGIEATTRTLQLRARASNPEGNLRPGLFASINLPLNNINDALLVPTQSIIPIQNGKKVFVARNGKAAEVKVETSTRTATSILVTSGLKEGDTVLTTGIMTLKEGAPVKVSVGKD
ncbi:efflux RND transporter periplasmic adaptor subunit [Rubrolithibacter danxiaensis]|uniref:efflux RND transporter periplasmic adaptor subunit n=1 Tax=Rubrolithibacter danxiaensis TaxID=3390805 RepID=UPI003BF7F5A9